MLSNLSELQTITLFHGRIFKKMHIQHKWKYLAKAHGNTHLIKSLRPILMKQKEPRSIFIFYFYFISFSFFFILSPSFSLLFFSSHHNFFSFLIFFLLLLRTFATKYLHSICLRWCNDSSSMLERCPSSSTKERGNDC
jgi:hypothetical protein